MTQALVKVLGCGSREDLVSQGQFIARSSA
jgi:hypothetical protein